MTRIKLTHSEEDQAKNAERWVKDHRKLLIERFAREDEHPPNPEPVSIFMAGVPGAGKTEYSKRLNTKFNNKAVRIDADEIRSKIEGYDGMISYIFQSACTRAVNNLFHHALNRNQDLILDATFAYAGAMENVKDSLRNKRKVEIHYIYQDPERAWELTKAREVTEKRKVDSQVFVDSYFKSIENVNKTKSRFGDNVELTVVFKEYEYTGKEKVVLKVDKLDGYLKKRYTREELQRLVK